jgi:regulation of enolase protein 1 (concanavalin A-like superfamily)
MLVSAAKGLAFQRRTAAGGLTTSTSGGLDTAPMWVKLARRGQSITASRSGDGANWVAVAQDTIAFTGSIYVGLAVSSHDTTRTATALFDRVMVTDLPAGWRSRDVGSVGVAGMASESGGTFTVRGAGADIWGTADAFHYAYRSLTGDGTIVARVASIQGAQAWTKMGVMMRGSTDPGSAHALMLVSAAKGLAFQRRTANGAASLHTAGGTETAPRWVKLARSGNVITASVSADGQSWIVVDSDTFTLPATILVGLVAHSHDVTTLATATFDRVQIYP